MSACYVIPIGPPAIAVRRAGRDKSGGQLINRVGIDTYFGSVNLLDIRRCEYLLWRAFSVNSPSVEHDHPIAVLSS